MFEVTTKTPLELRGAVQKISKTGTNYNVLMMETHEGNPLQFYCPAGAEMPHELKKGSKYHVTFAVSSYKGNDRLSVSKMVQA